MITLRQTCRRWHSDMADLRIVTDTREQEPYSFSIPTVRRALPAGDYSVEGLETRVAVERKSMADFVNTVIRSRQRFQRELIRLGTYNAACVVVECEFRHMVEGRYRADAHPNALLGTVASIILDFGIPVFFCSDRQCACRFTEAYLTRYATKVQSCERPQA